MTEVPKNLFLARDSRKETNFKSLLANFADSAGNKVSYTPFLLIWKQLYFRLGRVESRSVTSLLFPRFPIPSAAAARRAILSLFVAKPWPPFRR